LGSCDPLIANQEGYKITYFGLTIGACFIVPGILLLAILETCFFPEPPVEGREPISPEEARIELVVFWGMLFFLSCPSYVLMTICYGLQANLSSASQIAMATPWIIGILITPVSAASLRAVLHNIYWDSFFYVVDDDDDDDDVVDDVVVDAVVVD